MIQRVYAVIEAGLDEDHLLALTPITGPVHIESRKSFRDEREIAKALRSLADQIEMGMSFQAVIFKQDEDKNNG